MAAGRSRCGCPKGCEPTVIEKPPMPVAEAPAAAVAAALDEGGLAQAAAGARSACILICDITRPVPNRLFLRPLVERLEGAGIARASITVLVATGLHRPNLGAELAEVVGDPWVLEHVRVVNHDARDDAEHVDLGRTRRGTPIRLDRRFVEAEVRIATGLVEPHFMAGYSGGRKVIAPGIAHAETITTFHNHRFMSDPGAENCVLDGNPLHREQLEILDRIGGALALNTVIDDRRQLAFVNFGDCRESHLDAVAFVRRFAEVALPRRFATVVTSAAGYPLDKTYYQTVKGMVGALGALADGGRSHRRVGVLGRARLGGVPGRPATPRRGRSGRLPRRDPGQGPHADIDEWQTQMQTRPPGSGKGVPLRRGALPRRADAYRGGRHRLGGGRGRGEHRAPPRPADRDHSGGAVRHPARGLTAGPGSPPRLSDPRPRGRGRGRERTAPVPGVLVSRPPGGPPGRDAGGRSHGRRDLARLRGGAVRDRPSVG